jgi:DNA-directed RNA polymerase specialized sigma subunit
MSAARRPIVPLNESQRQLAADNIAVARELSRRAVERFRGGRAYVFADDMESDAMLGLMLAARRYDPSRGVPFDVYASTWIRGHIGDGHRLRVFGKRAAMPYEQRPRFVSLDVLTKQP